MCLCVCVYARVCMNACACEFYAYLALSHLSLEISEGHCDFPTDYTPQLFNTFEDKRVCRVSHSEGHFLPSWKGHLTMNTVKVTAECKPSDQLFANDSSHPLYTEECCTGEKGCCFSFVGYLCLSSGFLLAQVFTIDIYWLPFVLCSHNTKTTTWLDPRLAKKAKPPEKCEDGGTATLHSSMQPLH